MPNGKCLKCFPFFGTFPLVGALLRIWSSCIFCINNRYCTLDCLLRCIPLLYFTLMPLTPYVAMAAEDWEWRRVDLGGTCYRKNALIFLGLGGTLIFLGHGWSVLHGFASAHFPEVLCWKREVGCGELKKDGGLKEGGGGLKEFAFAPMK